MAGLDHQLALETPWLEAVTPVVYQTLVTFGKWDLVLAEPLPAKEQRFATEFALAGEIALRRGRAAEAVRQFRAATALEDGLAYAEPPTWYYPRRHSLGKALLAAGRPRDAEAAYRSDLARFPNNGWSLHSLAKSLNRQGKITEARRVKRMFDEAWSGADVRLVGSRY